MPSEDLAHRLGTTLVRARAVKASANHLVALERSRCVACARSGWGLIAKYDVIRLLGWKTSDRRIAACRLGGVAVMLLETTWLTSAWKRGRRKHKRRPEPDRCPVFNRRPWAACLCASGACASLGGAASTEEQRFNAQSPAAAQLAW